jgi:hypothetical protein
MSNFMKVTEQVENRINHFGNRLLQVQAHLKRGEKRAARAKVEGLHGEITSFRDDITFPVQHTVIGAQVGLLSGKGSILRGRIPGALVGAVAGWMYGQATACQYLDWLDELADQAAELEAMARAERKDSAE